MFDRLGAALSRALSAEPAPHASDAASSAAIATATIRLPG